MKRQPIDPEDILLRLDWTEDDDLEFKSGEVTGFVRAELFAIQSERSAGAGYGRY